MSHLTLDDRISIQECLDNACSIRQIAKTINKSPSTVLREIQNNKSYIGKRIADLQPDCRLKATCTIEHLCTNVRCSSPCRTCLDCKKHCPKYSPKDCEIINKSPYVCNACHRYNSCGYERITYSAVLANNNYVTNLKEAREGLSITPDQLDELNKLLAPLINKGQSIQHIYSTHKDEIPIAIPTLYKYIDLGVFSFKNADLRRKVKFKRRKTKDENAKLTKEVKSAILYRNYHRYLEYVAKNPDLNIVQMDTVVGCEGSQKVLLTLLFCSCNLMLAILLPAKTQDAVVNALNMLCDQLGIETFQKLFGVILTDYTEENTMPKFLLVAWYMNLFNNSSA